MSACRISVRSTDEIIKGFIFIGHTAEPVPMIAILHAATNVRCDVNHPTCQQCPSARAEPGVKLIP